MGVGRGPDSIEPGELSGSRTDAPESPEVPPAPPSEPVGPTNVEMGAARIASLSRETILVALTSAATMAVAFVVVPLLTKNMGVAAYGVFVQFQTTLDLALNFAMLGLPYALVRYLAGETDDRVLSGELSAAAIGIGIVSTACAGIVLVFQSSLSALVGGDVLIVWLIAVMIPLQSLTVLYVNHFRVINKAATYASIHLGLTIARLVALAFGVAVSSDLAFAIFLTVAFQAVALAVLMVGVYRFVGLHAPEFGRVRKFLSFSVPTVPTNLSFWVLNLGSRYVVVYFLGAAAVGAFHVAYLFGSIVQMVVVPFDLVLISALARARNEGDPEAEVQLFNVTLSRFFWIAIPIVVGISLLSEDVIAIVSTAAIAAETSNLVPIIAVGVLAYGWMSLSPNLILFVNERTRWTMSLWFIAAGVNLGLNFYLVPRIGLMGSAIATLVTYVGVLIGAYVLARSFGPIPTPWGSMARSTFAAAVMGVLIVALPREGIVGLTLVVLAAIVCYVVVQLGFERMIARPFAAWFAANSVRRGGLR